MRHRLILLASLILLVAALPAQAGLQMDLSNVFSGTAPAGPAPWAKVAFANGANPNTVNVTLTTGGLSSTEFISGWYLNFDDALKVKDLVFTYDAGLSTGPEANVSLGLNKFKADGDGYYDILLGFPTANNKKNRFTTGKVVTYTITSPDAITEASFDFLSHPKKNSTEAYKVAAHVQSIGACGESSGWISDGQSPVVPEPASMLVWSVLAGAAVAFGCWRKRA